jgi:putative SOS response-associated peptidase YedK
MPSQEQIANRESIGHHATIFQATATRGGGRRPLPQTAKDMPSTFNVRAESVAEKPMFRSAFKRNRCIIPASGYFEWKAMLDGKQR